MADTVYRFRVLEKTASRLSFAIDNLKSVTLLFQDVIGKSDYQNYFKLRREGGS